jgi:hypothetical protein
MIGNGTFDTGVQGWSFWPDSCSITRRTGVGLTGGAMEFRVRPPAPNNAGFAVVEGIPIASGQWYRLRFTVRSPKSGTLTVQMRHSASPYAIFCINEDYAIGPQATAYNAVFRADAADPGCRLYFQIPLQDSLYWIDDVSLRTVTLGADNPEDRAPVFVNASAIAKTFSLGSDVYRSIDGAEVSGSLVVPPYSARILIRDGVHKTAVQEPENVVPTQWQLRQNYPNPFNGSTRISFTVPQKDRVIIELYDVLGRRISTIYDRDTEAGDHTVSVDAGALSSGMYIYRMAASDISVSRRMLLLK